MGMQQPPEVKNETKSDVSTTATISCLLQQHAAHSTVGLRKRHTLSKPTDSTAAISQPIDKPIKSVQKITKEFLNETYSDSESDDEFKSKKLEYKNEENSQIICYRDKDKIIAIKNDSTTTKFNSVGRIRSKELVQFKQDTTSDEIVKYRELETNFSVDAKDVDYAFKLSKYERKTPLRKHDIISNTVDAWAKSNSKSMFTNIRDSIFGGGPNKVTYKPLVFGGTYPIDVPTNIGILSTKRYVSDQCMSSCSETESGDEHSILEKPKSNPKTFNIDRPLSNPRE